MPRPRGARGPCLIRFIPAHAGNTFLSTRSAGIAPVHPRSRGEHKSSARGFVSANGSSPLTRGTRHVPAYSHAGKRFIPAHAGNTATAGLLSEHVSVHPRSRGEHPSSRSSISIRIGSSPLTRGTLVMWQSIPGRLRFIPAHAGNTPHGLPPRCPRPVHPRSRGEHIPGSALPWHNAGSSPLTRGTHTRKRSTLAQRRFIPAHAGNTPSKRLASCHSPVHPRSRGEHTTRR